MVVQTRHVSIQIENFFNVKCEQHDDNIRYRYTVISGSTKQNGYQRCMITINCDALTAFSTNLNEPSMNPLQRTETDRVVNC